MEKLIIEQLKAHTQNQTELNKKTVWSKVRPEILHKISIAEPMCLSSVFFFEDGSPLFMTFHTEEGNQNHHYHDFFELNYVLSGYPIGVIDGHEIQLEPGQLYMMNPNAVHYFKSYNDTDDLILNIGFPVETFQKHVFLPFLHDPILNSFFIRYKIENSQHPSFIYLKALDERVDYFIDLMTNEYLAPKSYNRVVIESLITLLFSFILRSYDSHLINHNDAINPVIDYLYQNYRDCTIESVAAHFNYHPKYLSTLIHQHTNQTYRNLITKIKLQNSQHYLLYTDYTIEHIVDLIGYKEKSSFYNSFKKQYHVSPGDYRKTQTHR